jgi:GDP-4-dehydro-6-deoxy-D-mannose reductase
VRALVTGGTGFVGRHLVDALVAAGHDVVAAGLAHGGLPAGERLEWRELDVTDAAACRAAVEESRPGWVFHLAGMAHVAGCERDPERALAVNFGGTRAVLEACAAAVPRARVLLVSSAEVYGRVAAGAPISEDRPLRPATAYALSKACAELAGHRAAARGARVVIVRPFNHIGPGQTDDYVASAFARQLARIEAGSQPPVLRVGNLEAVRDLTDVRDAAAAYVAILERAPDGAVYNVTSGRATSVRQLLDLLVSMCRREVSVETDSARLRPIDVPVLHGSGAALEADIGPRTWRELRETLADLLDYWRAREPDASARR